MKRSAERADFDVATRLRLVEIDHDMTDARMNDFAAELRRIRGLLVGVLISVSTGSIMLALQTFTGG